MKTFYAACLNRLGLSQAEAASLHGTKLQTVKNWCVGRTAVPEGVWAELRRYEAQIIDRSEAIREAWEDSGEARQIKAYTYGEPSELMAWVDFFLGSNESPPIAVTVVG